MKTNHEILKDLPGARAEAISVMLTLIEKVGDQAPQLIADNLPGEWGIDRLRNVLSSYGPGNEGAAGAEVFPGASLEEIGSVMMQDIVGEYDTPEKVPEWAWLEQHCSFRHRSNGTDGVWEFVLSLGIFQDEPHLAAVPKTLVGVIKEAQAKGLGYIIFHQGT